MKIYLSSTQNQEIWQAQLSKKIDAAFFELTKEKYEASLASKEVDGSEYYLCIITANNTTEKDKLDLVKLSKKVKSNMVCCFHLPVNEIDTADQQKGIEAFKKQLTQNATVCFDREADMVLYFKTIDSQQSLPPATGVFNTVFISYGRQHSLAFVHKLYQELLRKGYTAWFDMNDIPLGVDFQEQIDEGITQADNFIYIISPHSVKSVYCGKEVELAVKLGKRIIPILHVFPSDCEDLIHPEVAKRNWVQMNQANQKAIELSNLAKSDLKQLLSLTDTAWEFKNDFNSSFSDLVSLLELNKNYVEMHTLLLNKALKWTKNQQSNELLLVGKERQAAEEWLSVEVFLNSANKEVQAPCLVTDLQANYIVEARKNAQHLMTDCFICYAVEEIEMQQTLVKALTRKGISSWIHSKDIKKGDDYAKAIQKGIESADNIVYLLSSKSLVSEYCIKELLYAQELNKRIIPVLIEDKHTAQPKLSKDLAWIEKLQYIDFSFFTDSQAPLDINRSKEAKEAAILESKSKLDESINDLQSAIYNEKQYINQHKVFLVHALRWQSQSKNNSILLRGFNLDNANTWLKLSYNKIQKALPLQIEFFEASNALVGQLSTDVFVSYSRTDSDFARELNYQLQLNGKTTWFDQESIASGADFQQEINKGIEQSDNFLFVISEDAVKSIYCTEEVEYAQKLGKRIITLLYRPTSPALLHPALAAVQWINFVDRDFNTCFPELLRTLDTDREHVNAHTKLASLAREWDLNKKNKDFLLNQSEYFAAYTWLANSKGKQPAPTNLQKEMIVESEKNLAATALKEKRNNKRLRILLYASFITMLSTIGLSIYGIHEKASATRQKVKLAETQIESYYKEAEAYKKNGEFDKAISKYKEAQNTAVEQEIQTKHSNLIPKNINICNQLSNLIIKADKLQNTDNCKEEWANCKAALVLDAEKTAYFSKIKIEILQRFKKRLQEFDDKIKYIHAAKGEEDIPELKIKKTELKQVIIEMSK